MIRSYPFSALAQKLLLAFSMLMSSTLPAEELASLSSDTITLKDGSIISGELSRGDSGVIGFISQGAGRLLVDMANVVELKAGRGVVLKFKDGRVVRLSEITITQEPLEIITQDGPMNYSLADIVAINPEPWMLGVGHHWTGSLIFALELQSGNTDKQELDLDLHSVWRQSAVRYTLSANGELDHANDVLTSNDLTVITKTDRFLTDTTYAGVNLYFEADEFAQLKRRLLFSAYYGKQWRAKPRLSLSTEPGLAVVSEKRTESEDQTFFAFSWNLDMNSNYLGPNTDSYLKQVGVWNMEDASDIVINNRIGIRMPVRPKITINVELKFDYDSGDTANVEEIDQTLTIGFGYRW